MWQRISRTLLEAECGGETLLHEEERDCLLPISKLLLKMVIFLSHINSTKFYPLSITCKYITSCAGNSSVSKELTSAGTPLLIRAATKLPLIKSNMHIKCI